MSRSRPNDNISNPNPAMRWFKWAALNGDITYYDKEREQNVSIKMPMSFLVLDTLDVVNGVTRKNQNGQQFSIRSNEVRSSGSESFNIYVNKEKVLSGMYRDISQQIKERGGHFNKSIYIAFYDEDNILRIGNLRLKGSALSAWFSYTAEHNVYEGATIMNRGEQLDNGVVSYYLPAFSYSNNVSEESKQRASGLDEVLQDYLDVYFNDSDTDMSGNTASDDVDNTSKNVPEQQDDEPELDDIPF